MSGLDWLSWGLKTALTIVGALLAYMEFGFTVGFCVACALGCLADIWARLVMIHERLKR